MSGIEISDMAAENSRNLLFSPLRKYFLARCFFPWCLYNQSSIFLMRHKLRGGNTLMYAALLLVLVAIGFSTSPALAALPTEGERLAASCAGCHGTRGASPGTLIPIIGGQSAEYLAKTMKGFKEGSRPGGVMLNISKGYSDQQIEQIAAAVSAWKWQDSPSALKKGKVKLSGSLVGTCVACHGTKGQGTKVGPHISGQPAGYLEEALSEYRSGRRAAAEMGMIKGLSDQELGQLIKYYSNQK
jgi:sulfide dehydrogenase cytochrome subunit